MLRGLTLELDGSNFIYGPATRPGLRSASENSVGELAAMMENHERQMSATGKERVASAVPHFKGPVPFWEQGLFVLSRVFQLRLAVARRAIRC